MFLKPKHELVVGISESSSSMLTMEKIFPALEENTLHSTHNHLSLTHQMIHACVVVVAMGSQ